MPDLAAAFEATFGRPPTTTADAPGRVNLVGEHTDYSGGYVLPTAIPQRCRVALAGRADRTVRAVSLDLEPGRVAAYRLGQEGPGRGWVDYVQGLTQVLRRQGHPLRGFDLAVASGVPVGAGLASSAALEVAVLRALRQAFALDLDDVRLALVGQQAENELVGARVGIMDQMAATLGDEESALFLDTRSLTFRRVPIPPQAELVVVDSGVSHQHAGGGYNTRRAECERAAALLGVPQLRDITPADLPRVAALPEPLSRRARHVLTENARVLAAVERLEAGDLAGLGEVLDASHASLRDDFQVSVPEVDLLVQLARAEPDVYGARLTGGGFGGAILAVARAGRGAAVADRVARAYADRLGRAARVLVAGPGRA